MHLTILICTHNRAALLGRVLESLNAAARPPSTGVDVLVVANACTDGTAALLGQYQRESRNRGWLPLRWVQEPTPGKSRALNRAIPLLEGDVVAFVDDDHRIDPGYLTGICRAADSFPQATLFCGRILPDWDGREPAWVHDEGPYRIYPLPVPRFDHGPEGKDIDESGPIPGGGNLFLRRGVFGRIGGFSTELGPHGHDLGGGEDSDFVLRALFAGERLRYVPDVVQHHYVDLERFRLGYLLRKSFERSRSSVRIRSGQSAVPLYMWRKVAGYSARTVFSLGWPARRFYLMRVAAAFGEVRGFIDSRLFSEAGASPENAQAEVGWQPRHAAFAAVSAAALGIATAQSAEAWKAMVLSVGSVSLTLTLLLLLKSITDFTQTGPQLKGEIRRHYVGFTVAATGRLAIWAFIILAVLGAVGASTVGALGLMLGLAVSGQAYVAGALAAICALVLFQFCRHLLFIPGSILASYHYRHSRLYPLWRALSPALLRGMGFVLLALGGVPVAVAIVRVAAEGRLLPPALALGLGLAAAIFSKRVVGPAEAAPAAVGPAADQQPRNVLLIGSDTLRADRLGAAGYRRRVTPFIDSLSAQGTTFTSCYVPCARTAPSLISLFTGAWPHTHGVRDNFVAHAEAGLEVPSLPRMLSERGYATATVSDWSGSDFTKFRLGFEHVDAPTDQWNVKYLLRQGPKDLRLFLSLFTHNWFGKRFLPELYYLAGVPLTSLIGRDARMLISQFAGQGRPFLLNVFVSTTHPPFGSEYPYYSMFSDPTYAGESKFVMARLTDPWEIIRRQGDSRKEFDLEQIIDLYDGCVRNFDAEVKRIVDHLRACGLSRDTIIVIYSDHGMEFFEHETWGQGNSVRADASPRIPLVIVDPRQPGAGTCPYVVRSIDLAPTLLELLGMPAAAASDGVSLACYLKPGTRDMQLPAFNETGIWVTDLPGMPANHLRYPSLLDLLEVPDKAAGTLAIKPVFRDIILEAKDRMVRRGPWKLTYQPTGAGPLYALYNVAQDPDCQTNVAHQHPEIVSELSETLRGWVHGAPPGPSEIRPADVAGHDGVTPSRPTPSEPAEATSDA